MDKIAMVKQAEVTGIIAGLVDTGFLKVASDDEFEALTTIVTDNISNEYDLDDVLLKTAEVNAFLKTADMIGALVGASRASNLTDKEKKALRKHYGLSEDANLAIRNVGRGILGSYGGVGLGALAGGGISTLAGAPPGVSALAGMLGSLAGYGAGVKLMTDKYSKGNVKKILGKNKSKN